MKAATEASNSYGRRYNRLTLLRRLLTASAWAPTKLMPPERLFPSLCYSALALSRIGRLAGFQTADALDPDLKGLALRELVRACRPHLGYAPFDFIVENEAELRRMQALSRGMLWCGLHHALSSSIVRIFELWRWPVATLAVQQRNPAWGGDARAVNIAPGPAALLALRRALSDGRTAIALLDSGRQSRPVVTVHSNLIQLAYRAKAPLVVYRAQFDAQHQAIRVHTRIVADSGCYGSDHQRRARAAVEDLYGASWGLQLNWTQGRADQSSSQAVISSSSR